MLGIRVLCVISGLSCNFLSVSLGGGWSISMTKQVLLFLALLSTVIVAMLHAASESREAI